LRFLRPAQEQPPPAKQPPSPSGPEAARDEAAPEATHGETPPSTPAEGPAASPPLRSAESPALPPEAEPPVEEANTAPPESPTEPSGERAQRPPEPLRFGVLAGRSVAATMNVLGPVAEDLQERLKRPVEILPMVSYDAMIDAQEQRRIDGGFYSAAAFALADARCRCLEPLVAPRAADGTLAYHAVIVTRPTSGISSVADLEGRTIAAGAADSIGARRMQLAGLMAEGLNPASFFADVRDVGSAEDAVRLVAAGGADAGFAWTSLRGATERGYSRGTLADLVAAGEIAMDELAIVWRSAAITHGPFAVARSMPDEEKAAIEAYLLALENSHPAAYDLLNPFYGGGYAAVDPQDYSGVKVLAAQDVDALGLPEAPPSALPPAD
jgi:phosphonate transport system substrate-binding protein